jgi:hypothetical protein
MRIPYSLYSRECIVEISFSDFLAMAVNVVQSFDGIDRNEIWCGSYVGAVGLVEGMQPEMAVSSKAVVKLGKG